MYKIASKYSGMFKKGKISNETVSKATRDI